MSGQSNEPEHAAHDPDTSTADAIARSRDFLEKKLIPDLEDATSFVSHLEASRDGYTRLQKELRTTLQAQQSKGSKTSVMAHLGQGVHIPVGVEANSLIIISSGLKESPEDWSSDAGLYMQLDRSEALTFAEKKISVLARKITMAKERVALIQSHAEMTTKSIDQLEQLQADPNSTLIDYLQT